MSEEFGYESHVDFCLSSLNFLSKLLEPQFKLDDLRNNFCNSVVLYGFMNLFSSLFLIFNLYIYQLHQCKNNIDSTANSQNGDVLMCMSFIFLRKIFGRLSFFGEVSGCGKQVGVGG